MLRMDGLSRHRTNWTELEAKIDAMDFSDGWLRHEQIVTEKGAYVIRIEPKLFDGKPVRFD